MLPPPENWTSRLLADTFARSVEQFDELDSTNNYALRAVAESKPELPAVIVARSQTCGRGRGNNRWWSAEGALTFSLILDERSARIPVAREPRIALLAGLAVSDLLMQYLPPDSVGLKWPNDVQIRGRKVCGILTEVSPQRRDVVIIGLGVNVNNSMRTTPKELREAATAICDETGDLLDLSHTLITLCERIERRIREFTRDNDSLRRAWRQRCVLSGRQITAEIGSRTITGRCCGIHHDGALVIETDHGTETLHSVTTVRETTHGETMGGTS